MTHIKTVLLTLFFAGCLSGCATMLGDNSHTVHVTSVPPGATVLLNQEELGKTPFLVSIDDLNRDNVISLRMNEYAPASFPVTVSFQKLAFLNFLQLSYCVFGWGVDYFSGNLYTIENPEISAKLKPSSTPSN